MPREHKIPVHMEVDAPIFKIRSEGLKKHKNGFLLPPGGIAYAEIRIKDIPVELRKSPFMGVASTSTFARHGIEIMRSHADFQRALSNGVSSRIIAIIHNVGRRHALVREGDPVRIMHTLHAFAAKGESSHQPLHLGNEVLVLDEGKLPTFSDGKIKRPYLDPRLKGKKSPFVSKPVGKGLKVKPGDFIVVSAEELLEIPRDMFGHVFVGHDALSHLSAKFIHSGFKGRIALEFLVTKPALLRKGAVVARLGLVQPNGAVELKQYTGRYQGQKSALPR